MNGLAHIQDAFNQARAEGRAALMPYYTLGFPDRTTSIEVLESIARAGADLIELGIPFSDPLADGPVIQHSTHVALEHGASVQGCLELVETLRLRGVAQPLLLMGYYNPILAYGVRRFVVAAKQAGADGFIVPDLPLEEAQEMEAQCQAQQLALVYLLAPTSTSERAAQIAQRTTGFLYLVSLTGVTGVRDSLAEGLEGFIQRARQQAKIPVAVGFGISNPQQAGQVGRLADGVIVGSALIKTVEAAQNPAPAAGEFVKNLRLALDTRPELI